MGTIQDCFQHMLKPSQLANYFLLLIWCKEVPCWIKKLNTMWKKWLQDTYFTPEKPDPGKQEWWQGHGHRGSGCPVWQGLICSHRTGHTVETGLCTLQRHPAPGQTGLGNRSAHFHWGQKAFNPLQQCQHFMTIVTEVTTGLHFSTLQFTNLVCSP